MSRGVAFSLLAIFTLGWLAFGAFEFYLTTMNSDCSYAVGEACTAVANYQQQVIIWRGIAVELVVVLLFKLFGVQNVH